VGGQKKTVSVSQAALYVNAPVPASFSNVIAAGVTGNTLTITTNAPDEDIMVTTTNTSMITNLDKVRGAVADDGTYTWTVTFDVSANVSTSPRSSYIVVTVGEQQGKTVSISQVAAALYVNDPVPASFDDVVAAGVAGNTFTITTNVPDENITVTATNTQVITNPTKQRGVNVDGSYTWTIGFDVPVNKNTYVRNGQIEVTIGGQKKTVPVSQVALFVYAPVPTSFVNVDAGGVAGNTFTLEMNAQEEDVTVTTTDPSMITNLTKTHGEIAADGSYTWTIGFNVTTNTTAVRSATISVYVNGVSVVTRTVSVSQKAITFTDGMSNCYMVIPGQQVDFPVSRAYTYTGTDFTNTLHVGDTYTGQFNAAVVWADAAVINGTPTVSGSGNTAIVTVKTTGIAGNAVVKIYKKEDSSRTPVWSYHIWASDYNGSDTYTNTNNNFVFMDRNLGATKAGLLTSTGTGANLGFGLFYQWGRKDPFPATGDPGESQSTNKFDAVATSGTTGTIPYTVQHPDEFLTENSNSCYALRAYLILYSSFHAAFEAAK
jgi:hypothetical protein